MPKKKPKPKPKPKRKPKQRQRTRPARATYGARAARPYAAALLAAVLVGTLVVVALSALGGSGGTEGENGDGTGGTGEDHAVEPLPSDDPAVALARREPGDPLAIGEPDAPVVMIEYADFQDAFVGVHARQTHEELVSEYVDAGVLRIEFRNYPINGPESDAAARAAWAAGRQDRFWEFYEAALGEEFNRDSGRFDDDGLRRLAGQAGIPDVERFMRQLDSDEAGEAVGRDAEEGYELRVTTLPHFIINGHPLSGAQNIDAFREIIDPLRAAEAEADQQ
jgi:protein-disulfide isomerase